MGTANHNTNGVVTETVGISEMLEEVSGDALASAVLSLSLWMLAGGAKMTGTRACGLNFPTCPNRTK